MTKQDFLSALILSEISDDYEGPEHVWRRASERAGLCGIAVEIQQVNTVLMDLISGGYAKAYDLHVDPPIAISNPRLMATISDYYFFITNKGKEHLLASRNEWPLDEEDAVLRDRLPLKD